MTKRVIKTGVSATALYPIKVQVGDVIPDGFSNIVATQISDNQARVDFDYFGPACTIYVRFKSNYTTEGKDVAGGFPITVAHVPEGQSPVSRSALSAANLVASTAYTAMLYSDDETTLIPAGNAVETSNELTMSGGVAPAPTVIYPSEINIVQNADPIGTVIATLSSDVPGSVMSEGTPDLALVSVGSTGPVPLDALADTVGSFVLKAVATTPGGAYNQDVTINVAASGGGGGTFNVTNAATLTTALNSAVAGDSISCAAGNYGSYTITKSFTDYVTIFSATPENPAVFTFLSITNSAYIKIDGVHVSATSNGSAGGKFMNITDSNHIQVLNSEINGLVDGTYAGSYGLYAKTCSFITYDTCHVHDCNDGIVAFGVDDLTVNNCLVDYVASDFFKFAGNDNIILTNNTGGGHLFPSSTAHADFMQFQGLTTNATITGNLFIALNSARAQGIFLGSDVVHNNILIEDNIIATGQTNNIRVNAFSTNITVRYNTCITVPGVHVNASIITPSDSTVQNNIRTVQTTGSDSGTNIVLQYSNSGAAFYVDNYYADAYQPLGLLTIADLAPVPGSAAETRGAFARIAELLA